MKQVVLKQLKQLVFKAGGFGDVSLAQPTSAQAWSLAIPGLRVYFAPRLATLDNVPL